MPSPKSNTHNPRASSQKKQSGSPVVRAKHTRGILEISIQATLIVSALSSLPYAAHVELSPLYGHTVAGLNLYKLVTAALFVSYFLPTIGSRKALLALTVLLCLAPTLLYRIAVFTSSLQNPSVGPTLTYALILVPIVYLWWNVLLIAIRPNPLVKLNTYVKLALNLGLCRAVVGSQALWDYAAWVVDPLRLCTRYGFVAALLYGYSDTRTGKARITPMQLLKSSRASLIIALILTLISLSQPPLRSLKLPYTHPSGLLRILSTTASLTGQIVVGESSEHKLRYLRADHSLLGGVWMGDKVGRIDAEVPLSTDQRGTPLGDSIYSAFVLQEAVRLQERPTSQENALIIGLGTGIAAQAFIEHGLSTSVIEIDPAVYRAARTYFGLSEPAAVYLEDARGWVARARSATSSNHTNFDIIVHDCFSGGGVPEHLFTVEFWTDLMAIMNEESIVAVNFAGEISGMSAKAIFATLEHSFGNCRAYHDYHIELSDEELEKEFINIVFFCTSSKTPLNFREAQREDYLSSYLRHHILSVFSQREINPVLLRGTGGDSDAKNTSLILTDARNPLGKWQEVGALHHWNVMETVLPGLFWQTY